MKRIRATGINLNFHYAARSSAMGVRIYASAREGGEEENHGGRQEGWRRADARGLSAKARKKLEQRERYPESAYLSIFYSAGVLYALVFNILRV